MFVPLLYAPLLPVLRIGLRNRVPPERLTQLTLGVIGIAVFGGMAFAMSPAA